MRPWDRDQALEGPEAAAAIHGGSGGCLAALLGPRGPTALPSAARYRYRAKATACPPVLDEVPPSTSRGGALDFPGAARTIFGWPWPLSPLLDLHGYKRDTCRKLLASPLRHPLDGGGITSPLSGKSRRPVKDQEGVFLSSSSQGSPGSAHAQTRPSHSGRALDSCLPLLCHPPSFSQHPHFLFSRRSPRSLVPQFSDSLHWHFPSPQSPAPTASASSRCLSHSVELGVPERVPSRPSRFVQSIRVPSPHAPTRPYLSRLVPQSLPTPDLRFKD